MGKQHRKTPPERPEKINGRALAADLFKRGLIGESTAFMDSRSHWVSKNADQTPPSGGSRRA